MRLIDATELKNFFGFMRKMWSASEIMRVINEAETVDAVEVVHGKWDAVMEYEDFQYAYCSACGKRSEYMTNYCPNCGAKMDGGNEDG